MTNQRNNSVPPVNSLPSLQTLQQLVSASLSGTATRESGAERTAARVTGLYESNPLIHGLASDSRTVKKGDLFFALDGVKAKGWEYIPEAIDKGAVAIISSSVPQSHSHPNCIAVENPRLVLAQIAAAFFGAQPQTILAVTGTNGKSSVVNFCQQLWQGLGIKAASIGTLGVRRDYNIAAETSLTTPDTISLHCALATLKQEGYDHVAIEASSHGIEQFRLDGVKFKAAGFTNLTHDHLDYHKTMEAYFEAKSRLFQRLLPDTAAVIVNLADPWSHKLYERLQDRHFSYFFYGEDRDRSGWNSQSTRHDAGAIPAGRVPDHGENRQVLEISEVTATSRGYRFHLAFGGKNYELELPMVARFQLYNCLCALGMVVAGGADFEEIIARRLVNSLQNVAGRLEQIGAGESPKRLFVDYAHSPDGLQTVLRELKSRLQTQTPKGGRLIVVFGCGGDRDKTKRPIMGAIAASIADIAIVTDDNPRSETAAQIRREIIEGMTARDSSGNNSNLNSNHCEVLEIGDRALAIQKAISLCQPLDLVIVAGKGHEEGQIINGVTLPFNDGDEIRKWL